VDVSRLTDSTTGVEENKIKYNKEPLALVERNIEGKNVSTEGSKQPSDTKKARRRGE
jgi:hypothetical protein